MNEWVQRLLERLEPLEIEVNRAWWDAAVTGRDADYRRLESARNAVDDVLREPDTFERLVEAREGDPGDPLLRRSIELLYLEALPRQVDPSLSRRMNALATEIERDFATHRPKFEGHPRTQNDLEEILDTDTDSRRLRAAWEALKSVGPRVEARLRELIGRRNEAAATLGFDDFYQLKLHLEEQEPGEIGAFFDRLDRLTAEPFDAIKAEVDGRLAGRHRIRTDELRPWHYGNPFFQEPPPVFGVELDALYADSDPIVLARRFFDGIGLEVDGILERSSLYEADGKDPHAFATDIDRRGDVRILLNLRPDARWVGTTLHELGHAVYDAGIDADLPWNLRRPAHTLTTEAIAMLFGRLAKSPGWMRDMGVVDGASVERIGVAIAREQRAQMLVFSRWAQVMGRFERALYADPDQDLNALWWDLKRRYQGLAPPDRPDGAADWAAKIHVVVAPVYYHNYLLGECFASQLHARLESEALGEDGSYAGRAEVGRWLTEQVFRSGARMHYDALARAATGSPVVPDAFAAQFVADAAA